MDSMMRNFNHFNDFIENFTGLGNIYSEDDLKIANDAIDRLLFGIEGVDIEEIEYIDRN